MGYKFLTPKPMAIQPEGAEMPDTLEQMNVVPEIPEHLANYITYDEETGEFKLAFEGADDALKQQAVAWLAEQLKNPENVEGWLNEVRSWDLTKQLEFNLNQMSADEQVRHLTEQGNLEAILSTTGLGVVYTPTKVKRGIRLILALSGALTTLKPGVLERVENRVSWAVHGAIMMAGLLVLYTTGGLAAATPILMKLYKLKKGVETAETTIKNVREIVTELDETAAEVTQVEEGVHDSVAAADPEAGIEYTHPETAANNNDHFDEEADLYDDEDDPDEVDNFEDDLEKAA